jgi:hypothetical protein
MKKYMSFCWVADGNGWYISNTLEEAKEIWCFGTKVFEIDDDNIDNLNTYGAEVKSNRLLLKKLTDDNYPLVYSKGEPPNYFVSK